MSDLPGIAAKAVRQKAKGAESEVIIMRDILVMAVFALLLIGSLTLSAHVRAED